MFGLDCAHVTQISKHSQQHIGVGNSYAARDDAVHCCAQRSVGYACLIPPFSIFIVGPVLTNITSPASYASTVFETYLTPRSDAWMTP